MTFHVAKTTTPSDVFCWDSKSVCFQNKHFSGINQKLYEFPMVLEQKSICIPNDSDFAWGDLYNNSQPNFYYYPFGSFVNYSDIDFTQGNPDEVRAAFLARYNELNNTNYNDITEIPAVVSTVGP